jgi:hypothetical protein
MVAQAVRQRSGLEVEHIQAGKGDERNLALF